MFEKTKNMSVKFLPIKSVSDEQIVFVIILAQEPNGKWLFVRHRDRTTWEMPAGHREGGETALEGAKRELYEETGAMKFSIRALLQYEGLYKEQKVFGEIFYASVYKMGNLPDFEIAEVIELETIPSIDQLTYPDLQPSFFKEALKHI